MDRNQGPYLGGKVMNIKSLRLSDQAVRGLIHPITGDPITPLGFRNDGRPIWPIIGAAEDGDEGDENEDGQESSEGNSGDDDPEDDESNEDGDESDDPDDDSKSKKKSKGDKDKYIKSLEERSDRLYRKRKEAEKRANDLEQELKDERAKKDGPEAKELREQISTLESENKTLKSTLREARIKAAFLSDNTHEWENPVAALKLTDLTDVEIDDDGTVDGMVEALAKTAEDHPYLLKKKKADPPKKSGNSTQNSKTKRETEKAEKDRLRKKYKIGG
jgi:hypothetical protein